MLRLLQLHTSDSEKILMAENLRRSTRIVKPNKDIDFEYEEEVIDALSGRQTLGPSVSEEAIVENYSDSIFIDCEEVQISPAVLNDIENINKEGESVNNSDIVRINQSPLRFLQSASLRASEAASVRTVYVAEILGWMYFWLRLTIDQVYGKC